MGLDGGTKISRSDVLRGASWRLSSADTSRSTRGGSISQGALLQAEKAEPLVERRAHLSTCYLTGDALQPPLVADYLGNIYTKAAVVEFLLARMHDTFADDDSLHRHTNILRMNGTRLDHLRRLRDVFDIHILPGNYEPDAVASTSGKACGAQLHLRDGLADAMCPLTQLPFVNTPFAVLVPCGHCLSCRAIKMAQACDESSTSHCSVCDAAYDADVDVIELNPSPDVAHKLLGLLPQRKAVQRDPGSQHNKKKKRKRAQFEVEKARS